MNVRTARLFVFSDFAAHPEALAAYREIAEGAPQGRVAFVLRDRRLEGLRRSELGAQLAEIARASAQHFLVSGEPELALALGADGVHSPSDGLPPRLVRQQLPSGAWLSRAAHDFGDLEVDDVAALDALVVSPVWVERKGRPALGEFGLLRWVHRVRPISASVGVIALGGATGVVLPRALSLGARAVAVMGAALEKEARANLLRALATLESLPESP